MAGNAAEVLYLIREHESFYLGRHTFGRALSLWNHRFTALPLRSSRLVPDISGKEIYVCFFGVQDPTFWWISGSTGDAQSKPFLAGSLHFGSIVTQRRDSFASGHGTWSYH
jgi:hypothetical protein